VVNLFRDLMMKSSKKQHNRYAKWQNLLLVITLLFMLVSALPNMYPEKAIIDVTTKKTAAHQLSAQLIPEFSPGYVKQILNEHNIEVDEITTSKNTTKVVLTDKSEQQSAEQLLIETLPQNYLIDSSIGNNSPVWLTKLGGQPIKLGLDLSGGVLFVLDVDTERAMSDKISDIVLDIKTMAREQRLRAIKVNQVNSVSLNIGFSSSNGSENSALFTKILATYPELTKSKVSNQHISFSYSEQEQVKFRQETMKQTLKTMRGRIEELGITEAVTQKQGKNRIRIELPGVQDPKEAKRIIGATASLDFYQLAKNARDVNVKRIRNDNGKLLTLNNKVVFSGSNIKNARAGRDEMGSPLVNLSLDSIGGDKMSEFSKSNIGSPMITIFSEFYRDANNEVVKKSKVISEAVIQAHLGSQFSITNMESSAAAQDLSLLLRAGSLSAPVTIVQQRTIAATLGADNIDNGIKALTIGVTITLLFMAIWYRRLGVIANVALALNLISLLGLMSLLPGAVLTLPGIAGLVLTVGMAVDTNVLIFERIKEELKKGRGKMSAIDSGYKNAFATILDANITTMITGIILYSIGYGPVKGFALIFCLGILTSMFTGVFVSRALTNVAFSHNKGQLLGVQQ